MKPVILRKTNLHLCQLKCKLLEEVFTSVMFVQSNLPESESPAALQRLIRASILGAPDGDKKGLPRVMDSVEVRDIWGGELTPQIEVLSSIFTTRVAESTEMFWQQFDFVSRSSNLTYCSGSSSITLHTH